MAQNEQLEIGIVAQIDTSQVEAGFAKVTNQLGDLGATAESTIENKLINKIQRTKIVLESAGSAVKKLQLELAASPISDQRKQLIGGVLETLAETEKGTLRTSEALAKGAIQFDKYGLSAKQTAAALRQVPAQFTDIIVSLQGGQAPLTVLLQQGGQLKDVFGGVGNAARALGGYILGLVNPFTVAAGAAALFGTAIFKGSSELEEFQKTVILTGGAIGVTATGLSEIARQVDLVSDSVTQSQAAKFLNSIAGSALVGRDNLAKFTKAAIEFSSAGGDSLENVIKNFEALGRKPAEASAKLNETNNYLTLGIYQQIAAFEKQGKTVEAATLAQTAYADAIQKRTPELLGNLGYIETAWQAIGKAASEAWDFILGVGRKAGPIQQAEELENQAAILRSQGAVGELGAETVDLGIADALDAQAAALRKKVAEDEKAAQQIASQKAAIRDAIADARALKESIESQTAAIKAKIEASKLEQSLLEERGLDAEKILGSEKKLLELQQQRSAESNPQKQAVLDTLIGYQKQLVILDKINQATRANLQAKKDQEEEDKKQEARDIKREMDLRKKLSERVRSSTNQFNRLEFENFSDPEKYTAELRKLNQEKEFWLALGIKEADVLRVVEAQQKKLFEQYTDIGKVSKEFARSLSQGLEDAIISGKNFSDILKQIEQDILRIITRQLITQPFEKAISDLGFSFFGGGTQSPAPISTAIPVDFGGPRASGGPVTGSTMYLVGEQGPELFVPSTSGAIIPNNQMSSISGGSSVNVSNVFYLANATDMRTQQQIAAQTGMSVQRAMARNT